MIKGAKAGQQKQHKPVVAQDSASSISTLKILYGLSEGEISGLADGAKSIYLDDTPVLDDNGNPNFKNSNGSNAVVWDFRSGTNDQDYIKGFPSVENETSINVELKGGTPYIKTVTNSQLSAVRLRLSWAALRKQETNGDVNGITIEYAIDLSTNGGAYQQVLLTKVSDKTSAKYERSHRIDLPRANTWNIRVRRLTPNATSDLISDKMYVDAITEIIDAKLRYPNTAMLGLQYNAATFSNVAKLAVRCKGKIISVPSNYDPVARTCTGVWNGTFKQAYSNNPAWVYYDICTQWRYGLGSRITAAMIDKWSLYALAQYCDQQVSDGKGGQEPRFTVNVYLQAQQDAFAVLQSLSAIFRAMSYWQGEQIVLDADLPKDPVYTFSRANVVDGEFSYTGTRARDRHTIAKVAWDNPEQKFKTEYEFVRDEAAIAKYGVKVLDLSIVGCTSQGQAQRAGLWALKSEQLETRTVTFKTGLDGFIPTVGSIINVSDEVLAGRANGGRVSAVSTDLLTVTVDRDVVVSVGDTLIVNADNGKAQRRIVSAVNGRNVSVSVAFDGVSPQSVWAVDSSSLKVMRFRVLSIKQDGVTFTIAALQHEPQKYDAIDYGTIVHDTTGGIRPAPIPQSIAAPSFVTLSQRNRTEQTQNITTLIIAWGQVSGAVAYNVEWRKDDGDWQNIYNVNKNSAEVDGVYAGNYVARVRAISAYGATSGPALSNVVAITGKTHKPSNSLQLTAVGILFGMRLRWVYPANSTDTNYTEIQMATEPNTNVSDLGKFAYPTDTHTMQGMAGNLTLFFRARLVDKVGNIGDWTDWVEGTTSADAKAILDLLNGQIKESQLHQDLGAKIAKISTIETGLSKEIQDRVDAQAQEAIDRSDAIYQETQNRIAAVKSVSDGLTQEIIDRKNGDINTLQVISTYKASNDNAMAAVQSDINAVTTAQSATASKLDGVYAIVTPLTADSTLWTADSGTKAATAWTLQSAYATADMALSQKIDNVSSTYNDSLASVQRETKTVSDKYSALATDVNIIKAAQSGNLALVMDNYYTKATTDQIIAQKISTFKADIVDPALEQKADAGALQETSAKADRIDGQLQAASTKLDGVYAKVSPLTADSNSWGADSGSKAATAWTLQSAIADSERVVSNRVDALSAELDNDIASIRTTQQALTTTSLSQAVKIESLGAAFANADNRLGTNEAAIRTEQVARASGDQALAMQITTLSTTSSELVAATADHDEYIKQNTATIQQQQYAINGLYARWSIKVDINGRISGIGFAATGDTSDFAIRADKFYIAPPDSEGKGDTPFIVLSTAQQVGDTIIPAGTYIKSAYIHDASIDTLKIRSQAVSVVAATKVNLAYGGTVSFSGSTQAVYLDAAGSMVQVTAFFMGAGFSGQVRFDLVVNGSVVDSYISSGSSEASLTLPFVVSGGYGNSAYYINVSGSFSASAYTIVATALKR